MGYKIIVAHPGRQHSFRLATALKKDKKLFKYITTVYNKESSVLMKITKLFLGSDNLKRANSRRCEALEDCDVIQFCESKGLIELLLLRIDKTRKLYTWWNKITNDDFGKKVARYAIRNNADAVIMYDSTATSAFEMLRTKAPHIKRIMDTSSASQLYMKAIFQEIVDKTGEDNLITECAFFWSQAQQNRFYREVFATDFFLVPSNYVKRSLIFNGISKEKIYIVPYGANLNIEANKDHNVNGKTTKFLFVGQCTLRKGVNYLLKAFSELKEENIELTLVGSIDKSSEHYKEYCLHEKIKFYGHVTHDKMMQIYGEHDVFVFPSLSEGLTLAGLEAMGCGLPIICTTNSGIDDLVVDGENGFVIPICSCEKIKEKIVWFVKNKKLIPSMGEKARQSTKKYTWINYNKNISDALDCMLK